MSDLAELLERYRRAPEFVAMILTGAAGEEVDFVTEPGKWSIRQIMRHLADSEIVGAMRLRQVAAEDNPTIVWYDEKAWSDKLDYSRRKPAQSLELFRKMRVDNYEFIKDMPEDVWSRVGTHSKVGVQTFRQFVE